MKTRKIISALVLVAIAFCSQAQHYRNDGMPDMRYSENRVIYSNSYDMPLPTQIEIPTSFPSSYPEPMPEVRYQSGYVRTDGTFVEPHYNTVSNNTNLDNFSTVGNTNPYTGETGTRARDYSSGALNYGVGETIFTGPRGGQYYINDNGNKTYVPKQPF